MKKRILLFLAVCLLIGLFCGCIPSDDEDDPTAPSLPSPSVTVPSGGEDPNGTFAPDAPVPTPPAPDDPFPGGKDDPLPTQAPGSPDDPGQPGRPTEPGQPGRPTEPGQPDKPTEPGKPTDPTQPTQPLPPDSAEDLVTMPASPEDLH